MAFESLNGPLVPPSLQWALHGYEHVDEAHSGTLWRKLKRNNRDGNLSPFGKIENYLKLEVQHPTGPPCFSVGSENHCQLYDLGISLRPRQRSYWNLVRLKSRFKFSDILWTLDGFGFMAHKWLNGLSNANDRILQRHSYLRLVPPIFSIRSSASRRACWGGHRICHELNSKRTWTSEHPGKFRNFPCSRPIVPLRWSWMPAPRHVGMSSACLERAQKLNSDM